MKKIILFSLSLITLPLLSESLAHAGSVTGTVCGLLSAGTLCKPEAKESLPTDGQPGEVPEGTSEEVATTNDPTVTYTFSETELEEKSAKACLQVMKIECVSEFVDCNAKTLQDLQALMDQYCSPTVAAVAGKLHKSWKCGEVVKQEADYLLKNDPIPFQEHCEKQAEAASDPKEEPTLQITKLPGTSGPMIVHIESIDQKPKFPFIPEAFPQKPDFTLDPDKARLAGEEEANGDEPTEDEENTAKISTGALPSLVGGGCSISPAALSNPGLAEDLAGALPWGFALVALKLKGKRRKKT
ncbi:MAG: hypothetical protein U1F66_03890 [bacterium]